MLSRCFGLALALILSAAHLTAHAQAPAYLLQWGSLGSGPGQFVSPSGISVDVNGFVYVSDQYNHRIQKFTSDGVFITSWGSLGTGPGQFSIPFAVAVDAAANVYVVDNRPRVQVFTADGTFVREWTHPSPFAHMVDIKVDAAGTIYAANQNGTIDLFTSTGTLVRSIGMGELLSVRCVAVDGAGNVFVGVDYGSVLEVVKFDPFGNVVARWGQPGSGDGQFNSPAGLAVDELGRVFVADYRNHRVQIFTNAGIFVGKWGHEGTGPGEFRQPVNVALAPGGQAYVVDLLNNRVQKFGGLPTPIVQATWGAVKASYR